MSDKIKIELGPVQKTLLIPLWGRADEYKKQDAIIRDKYAYDIVDRIDYDFDSLAQQMTDLVQVNTAIRAYHLDRELKAIIDKYPDATIVNLGAGLDTTFFRVDNGRIHWYDLDMPDSMALRKQLIPESPRNTYIIASAFDKSWYEKVNQRGSKVIFIAAGVLVYFPEAEVRELMLTLAEAFPGGEMIFESYAPKLLYYREKSLEKRGAHSDMLRQMQWGLRSGKELQKWSENIKLVEQYGFYSRVPVTQSNRKVIKQFRMVNWLGWMRIVHIRFV